MAGSRWIPLDVGYFHNPKARAAGKNGRALHVASSCWSADHMTDGRILPTDLALLCAEAEVPKATAKVLVEVGLWDVAEDGNGWVIHDFLVHNKSRESIEEQRRAWAAKKQGQRGVSPYVSPGDTHETPAIRQTDRQTQRLELVLNDDDYSNTGHRSSSSEEIIACTARALALKDRDNPAPGYVNGIARNLRAEQMPTVQACISEGLSLYDAALRLGADPWFARKAIDGSSNG